MKSNFTSKEIRAIKQYQVFIGMSEAALYLSIGEPMRVNETIVEGLEQKQCIYGDGIFIYVVNGTVSAYQNLESLKPLYQ